jgi:phospholipid-binding lipoprotein MlaA
MSFVTRGIVMLTLAATLGGCATTATNPNDPLEGFNRAMFTFNDALDQAVLKPAAAVYQGVLPTFVQTGIGNFFGNIGDVWTAVNNLLQGKVAHGVSDVMRVALNTTLGLGGLLDISSEAGLQKHWEDFGQTLAIWGVGNGPYVVLPFLGSSTMRDTLALPVDFAGDLWTYATPVRLRNTGSVVRVIDSRAAVLNASNLIEDAALDRYEFIRDAYLQRRANKINEDYNVGPDRDEKPKDDKSSAIEQAPAADAVRQATADQAPEPAAASIVQLPVATESAPSGKDENASLSRSADDLISVQRAPSSELPV